MRYLHWYARLSLREEPLHVHESRGQLLVGSTLFSISLSLPDLGLRSMICVLRLSLVVSCILGT